MLFLTREKGQGLVAYALILVLVAIVVIVILAIPSLLRGDGDVYVTPPGFEVTARANSTIAAEDAMMVGTPTPACDERELREIMGDNPWISIRSLEEVLVLTPENIPPIPEGLEKEAVLSYEYDESDHVIVEWIAAYICSNEVWVQVWP